MSGLPLVGVPTDRKMIGPLPFLAVGEKYVRAVVDGAGCLPLLIPALQPPLDPREVLAGLDGLLLTGAVSNIEPHHYSDEPSYPGNLHDPARDATNLALIPYAIEMDLPILAICRGFQEVNVALGGRLHQKVHEIPGFMNHDSSLGALHDDHDAEDESIDEPIDRHYAPAHAVNLHPGSMLATLTGGERAEVNSLHGQGIATLGAGLEIEATAPDGLIEAYRRPASSFLLAVQWHPEWRVRENPFYLAIFRVFGEACRRYAQRRRDQPVRMRA